MTLKLLKKTHAVFLNNNRNNIGYHYTSIEAFQSILSTKSLMLTSYEHLNDPVELKYGLNLFKKHLKYLKYYGLNDGFLTLHQKFMEEDEIQPLMRLFTFSTSKEENLLGQWKGYGSQGLGVCIKLDLNRIRKSNGVIGNVLYDPGIQNSNIKRIYKLCAEWLKKEMPNKPDKTFISDFAIALYQSQYMASTLMKHPGWKEEVELRYLQFIRGNEEFSEIGGKTRFLLPIDENAILKVLWGPKMSLSTIEDFKSLHTDFFNKTYDSKSNIPWR